MVAPRLAVLAAASLLLAACHDTTPVRVGDVPSAQAAPDDWKGILAIDKDRLSEKQIVDPLRKPFDSSLHVILVKDKATQRCSDELGHAQWNQDRLLWFHAAAHFDNCAFEAALTYIDQLLLQADAWASRGDERGTMAILGKILHAIQDFYAHTDYVERMARAYSRLEDVPRPKMWEDSGRRAIRDLVKAGMRSGRTRLSTPWQCPGDGPAHDEMNKDTPRSPSGAAKLARWEKSGFQAAYWLADSASIDFMQYAFGRWPFLVEKCGGTGVVGYLLLVDRRSE